MLEVARPYLMPAVLRQRMALLASLRPPSPVGRAVPVRLQHLRNLLLAHVQKREG